MVDTVGDDGILVDPDPIALAGAVERLAADPELWRDLARRGSERSAQLPWSALLGQLEDLYRRIVP